MKTPSSGTPLDYVMLHTFALPYPTEIDTDLSEVPELLPEALMLLVEQLSPTVIIIAV